MFRNEFKDCQHIADQTLKVESAVGCCNSRLIYKFKTKRIARNSTALRVPYLSSRTRPALALVSGVRGKDKHAGRAPVRSGGGRRGRGQRKIQRAAGARGEGGGEARRGPIRACERRGGGVGIRRCTGSTAGFKRSTAGFKGRGSRVRGPAAGRGRSLVTRQSRARMGPSCGMIDCGLGHGQPPAHGAWGQPAA